MAKEVEVAKGNEYLSTKQQLKLKTLEVTRGKNYIVIKYKGKDAKEKEQDLSNYKITYNKGKNLIKFGISVYTKEQVLEILYNNKTKDMTFINLIAKIWLTQNAQDLGDEYVELFFDDKGNESQEWHKYPTKINVNVAFLNKNDGTEIVVPCNINLNS